MATDDDAATLRERVRELEQTVAQQQDTIEQLMPSRRAVLAGGAGLVGGAALTGQASAQSAAGQVGTSSEPVDVEAASVNVQEGVSTPSAFVSGTLTASDVNTDSVNTDSTNITGHTVGTSKEYLDLNENSDRKSGSYIQYTDGVSTTATSILDISSGGETGSLALVFGERTGSFTRYFTDLVLWQAVGGTTVVASETRNSPASRTYSVNTRQLELAMSSGTFNIATKADALRNGAE